MGIRLADGAHKAHRRMAHQRLFDDRRVDVVATPDDQILRTARDEQIAIRVDPAQIPGPQEVTVREQALVLVGLGVGRPFIHAGA